jgi:integrase
MRNILICHLFTSSHLPSPTFILDVKQDCIDYLKTEQARQEEEDLLGFFVLQAGNPKRPSHGDRLKPLHPDSLSKSFTKMIKDEGMDPAITVYSLRHTYATMALRSGVDLRTVQRNMEHSDIRTTMGYLHQKKTFISKRQSGHLVSARISRECKRQLIRR